LKTSDTIIKLDDPILLTGATGFIGARVLATLQRWGFTGLRCLVRPSSKLPRLEKELAQIPGGATVKLIRGNLLSPEDCLAATEDVAVIYHLAAGTASKSFADAFLNSVVTTRNLLDGALRHQRLRRFVNVSSFSVYTNEHKPWRGVLDESCPTESHPELRADAYCFAKMKQDEMVIDYGQKHRIPYVIIRPGVVYGPGKERIHGRVGLGTFGIFLHLGGSNPVPLTHVENCAEAIALAGIKEAGQNEVFNVVDDDLPSSRQFLRMYKQEVRSFRSLYIPHFGSYLLCLLWEKIAVWSQGQLPAIYNRRQWAAMWKRTEYSNEKIKKMLGWTPQVCTAKGLKQYFASCREESAHA
jgi:nucleoside-diphosphate-sugar epimerase